MRLARTELQKMLRVLSHPVHWAILMRAWMILYVCTIISTRRRVLKCILVSFLGGVFFFLVLLPSSDDCFHLHSLDCRPLSTVCLITLQQLLHIHPFRCLSVFSPQPYLPLFTPTPYLLIKSLHLCTVSSNSTILIRTFISCATCLSSAVEKDDCATRRVGGVRMPYHLLGSEYLAAGGESVDGSAGSDEVVEVEPKGIDAFPFREEHVDEDDDSMVASGALI